MIALTCRTIDLPPLWSTTLSSRVEPHQPRTPQSVLLSMHLCLQQMLCMQTPYQCSARAESTNARAESANAMAESANARAESSKCQGRVSKCQGRVSKCQGRVSKSQGRVRKCQTSANHLSCQSKQHASVLPGLSQQMPGPSQQMPGPSQQMPGLSPANARAESAGAESANATPESANARAYQEQHCRGPQLCWLSLHWRSSLHEPLAPQSWMPAGDQQLRSGPQSHALPNTTASFTDMHNKRASKHVQDAQM